MSLGNSSDHAMMRGGARVSNIPKQNFLKGSSITNPHVYESWSVSNFASMSASLKSSCTATILVSLYVTACKQFQPHMHLMVVKI